MATVGEIKKRSVYYYAGGKRAPHHEYRAMVSMRRDDKTLIGVAYFHRDAATEPDTDSQTPAGAVHCHFLSAVFPRVLDLLRNERPLYFRYAGGEWNVASSVSSPEPAGEGEGAATAVA